jgi:myo-inositol-1(or 4)-monophosphatase
MEVSDRFIRDITKEAGKKALQMFRKTGADHFKSDNIMDVVTKADVASEQILIHRIRAKFPQHGIIAEESGSVRENAEYVWILDPIDGTYNFSTAVPLWSVLVALAYKKEVVMSAVYIPTTDEFFFAKKGKGAFLNGKKVRCSRTAGWARSVGGGPSHLGKRNSLSFLRQLLADVGGENAILQNLGGTGISAAYVACGRRDWYAGFSAQVWDYAANALLLQEAGCKVTGPGGKPWKLDDKGLIAANPKLHSSLMRIIRKAKIA